MLGGKHKNQGLLRGGVKQALEWVIDYQRGCPPDIPSELTKFIFYTSC